MIATRCADSGSRPRPPGRPVASASLTVATVCAGHSGRPARGVHALRLSLRARRRVPGRLLLLRRRRCHSNGSSPCLSWAIDAWDRCARSTGGDRSTAPTAHVQPADRRDGQRPVGRARIRGQPRHLRARRNARFDVRAFLDDPYDPRVRARGRCSCRRNAIVDRGSTARPSMARSLAATACRSSLGHWEFVGRPPRRGASAATWSPARRRGRHERLVARRYFVRQGFHNTHHASRTARAWGRWYGVDLGFALIRGLERLGLVHDVQCQREATRAASTA